MIKSLIHKGIGLVSALVCIVFAVQTVAAHSVVKKSSPENKAVLETAPAEVRIWLSEKIEPNFSAIEVYDAQNVAVHTGKPMVTDDRLQLAVALKEIGSGAYTVKWRIVSVDGHSTKGTFSFQIK